MTAQQTHLQQQLVVLRTRLLVMCAATGLALDDACRALLEGDTGRASAVIDGDNAVNTLENDVDERAFSILVRSQPVAVDLRFVVSALRMSGDLERIGDEASSIAERVILMQELPPLPFREDLARLMALARKLYADAVAAFRENDKDLALVVSRGSNEAMRLEDAIIRRLMQDPDRDPHMAVHLILITRALNRVWRRATNIAEHAYFVAEGINIRHTRLTDGDPAAMSPRLPEAAPQTEEEQELPEV